MIPVQIKKLHQDAIIPEYAHLTDAGADLFAVETVHPIPGSDVISVPTGLAMAIPDGYELQIRSKSGLACMGTFVINSPGTVDSGYRGEIRVLLTNTNKGRLTVVKGQKVAQAVLKPIYRAQFQLVDELPEADRGNNGFGSTGLYHQHRTTD